MMPWKRWLDTRRALREQNRDARAWLVRDHEQKLGRLQELIEVKTRSLDDAAHEAFHERREMRQTIDVQATALVDLNSRICRIEEKLDAAVRTASERWDGKV